MNASEKERILSEARATCERVDRIIPRNETAQQSPPPVDRLDAWRAATRKQEAAFNASRAAMQAEADAARAAADAEAWKSWIGDEIAVAVRQVASGIGEVLREELDRIGEQLSQRDAVIRKHETVLAQQAAAIAKLELRIVQNEVERDRSRTIDIPNMQLRSRVN